MAILPAESVSLLHDLSFNGTCRNIFPLMRKRSSSFDVYWYLDKQFRFESLTQAATSGAETPIVVSDTKLDFVSTGQIHEEFDNLGSISDVSLNKYCYILGPGYHVLESGSGECSIEVSNNSIVSFKDASHYFKRGEFPHSTLSFSFWYDGSNNCFGMLDTPYYIPHFSAVLYPYNVTATYSNSTFYLGELQMFRSQMIFVGCPYVSGSYIEFSGGYISLKHFL